MTRRMLLGCGIAAPVLYVAMMLLVGLAWRGYSVTAQTPSELSAIGAPTRSLWMVLGTIYGGLMLAFGITVWRSPRPNRALRLAGACIAVQAALGLFWPPMHQREVLAAGGGTLTDSLHLLWATITVVLFVLAIAFGAAALGRRFRAYSIATLVVLLVCGLWTATYASRIGAGLPTPGVGVWERISIAAFMSWVVVLAAAQLRNPPRQAARVD